MWKKRNSKVGSLLSIIVIASALIGCEKNSTDAVAISRAGPGSVNIYRDIYGTPHLYAELEEDGYWGLGYTTAEDRLKGVLLFYLSLRSELAKEFGSARISTEILGRPFGGIEDPVASDIQMKKMRHLEAARINFPKLPLQLQLNMKAYIAGLRQYMADNPEKVPGWAPALEPALPLAAASMVMVTSSVCRTILSERQVITSGLDGSNIWAFPAKRMKENAAVFSSDSHSDIEWQFGTFFASARINAGRLDAWQLDVPGMVLGLKGHSRNYAWGWSEGPRRPADCIVVETLKNNPTSYLYDGKLQKMQVHPYVIEVKGEEPIRGNFEYTYHNNVLSPVILREGNKAFAQSSAYMDRAGFAHKQFREMFLATDKASMRKALEAREIYPANLIYAGADGSIAYIRPGRIPRRPKGSDGSKLVNGNSSAGEWKGIHALEDLVQIEDPVQGYLANNNVSPDMMFRDPLLKSENYPPDFAFNDGFTNTRQKRAIDLFEVDRKFSLADTLSFVMDDYVWGSEKWGKALAFAKSESLDSEKWGNPDFENFFDALVNFDGHFSPHSRGALYHALMREKLRNEPVDNAYPFEVAIHKEVTLTRAQQRELLSLVEGVYAEVNDLGGAGKRFGDIFRVGRGGVSEPSRGYSLGTLSGDQVNTVSAALWSAVYSDPDKDGIRWSQSGSRNPFLVQFTKPISSYSLSVYGSSDHPDSPFYSDQSKRIAEDGLHSNYFEPSDLETAVSSYKTRQTR